MSYSRNEEATVRCECHDCVQARYRMSFQYQIDKAMNPIKPAPTENKPDDRLDTDLVGVCDERAHV